VKRIAVLGCTGSIGSQTLQAVDWHPDQFEIVALAARSDSTAFRELVQRRRPAVAVVADGTVGGWEPPGVRLLQGEAGLAEAATLAEADLVVIGTAGRAGLRPTLAALEHGKPVALANKEALVTAGHLVMRASRASGAAVLPVDSEHSAVWQCLMGESASAIRRIVLTASGGALRDLPLEELAGVGVERALAHPNW
jgi:1-deoxy-D-xylulose-5-phosphate reductoisomerase